MKCDYFSPLVVLLIAAVLIRPGKLMNYINSPKLNLEDLFVWHYDIIGLYIIIIDFIYNMHADRESQGQRCVLFGVCIHNTYFST